MPVSFAYRSAEFKTMHAWHHNVYDRQMGKTMVGNQIEGLLAGGGCQHVEASRLEFVLDQSQGGRVIIHCKDTMGLAWLRDWQ
jgi:hypothetical protein